MITAHQVALRYDDAISAYWRGEPDSLRALESWLSTCWNPDLPHPSGHPVAVNPHAAGGQGFSWYEDAGSLVGVVPGRSGCYHVSARAELPADPAAPSATPHLASTDPPARMPNDQARPEDKMQTHPLDDLADLVLEQHGDAVRSTVARLVERERGGRQTEPVGRIRGHAYDLREIARQPLQAGCWVAVGEVISPTSATLVEVQVSTGRFREVAASPA